MHKALLLGAALILSTTARGVTLAPPDHGDQRGERSRASR